MRTLNGKHCRWLLVGCLALVGCHQNQGVSANPDVARSVLKEGLDGWKAGETLDAFTQRTQIIVSERRWSAGTKLVSYEMATDHEMNGFDWQCTVKTTVKSADGKTAEEKATYAVSTDPKRVIVRLEN